MIFGVVFAILGLAFGACLPWAVSAGMGSHGWGVVGIVALVWTSVGFVAGAAGWLWPHGDAGRYRRVRWLYGKRADGTRAWWSALLLMPLVGPMWVWWNVRRPHLREAPVHRLAEGLTIGRRLLDREFDSELAGGVDHVIDLTSEYAEGARQRAHPGYVCLPIVDGAAPPDDLVEAYARRIAALQGEVFVHCAEGHGRTALIAGAVLLLRGEVDDAAQAFARVAAVRPKATPYPEQRRALERVAASLRAVATAVPS